MKYGAVTVSAIRWPLPEVIGNGRDEQTPEAHSAFEK